MSIPVRQPQPVPAIQAASDEGSFYQATLQDGTILWIPKEQDNSDCARTLAWALEENVEL